MSTPHALPRVSTRYIRETCLCVRVQRAARALARHFDDALRDAGLTHGQFSLLVALDHGDAPTIGEVSAALAMDRTTLTAALKPLERRGLVKVTVDRLDRRSRLMKLTAKGGRLLARAAPIWEDTHREVESLLADGNPEGLRNNLRALS